MTRWAMVIDLRRCIGCQACSKVCKQTNKVPPDHWRWIVDGGLSDPPQRERMSVPMSCMHCEHPPCQEVCPTTATFRRPDGIVDVDYELCIGCGYCIVACPYMARSILFQGDARQFAETLPVNTDAFQAAPDHNGVCTKCHFCLPRLEAGLAKGLQPGVDAEATPACVIACTAGALHFGNLDDPESTVSQLIRENQTARLQEELGTAPSVFYIVE
ncbi:MAG: 4Fe-4S dicluster domain-containing protein [Chloroflexota bacterium]